MTKVEIIIEDSHYAPSVKEGRKYTSVDYWIPSPGLTGASVPCDTFEQIQKGIKVAKEHIISFGFTPVIKDLRKKCTLSGY